MLYQLVYDSGIRDPSDKVKRLGDRPKNMLAHPFRKFFENKCLESGIDMFYVSVLMGYTVKGIGVERHYYRPTSINGENSLLELYFKRALPYVTISEESRLKLKNRELENRMREDEERYKKIKEDTEKMTQATTNQMSQMILELTQRLERLEREKEKKSEENKIEKMID